MSRVPMPDDEQQPKPVYFTPTKSAARVLEELVRKPDSLDNNSKITLETFSSSNSGHTADENETPRSKPRSLSPPLPPTPPLRSRTPRVATTSSKSSASRSPDSTSTSHRLKHTSRSLPRRSGNERPDRHQTHHRRHHSDPSTETPPPTDSHHGRHRYAGSHSRFTSDSISSIMAVTAERLARETARANEAERHANEVLSLFKTTHEAKIKLERELQKVKDELGLYKVQLDVAQKEIFRAQEVVDKIERQRADAEEELLRTKEKMRKLARNLAVEHAMEEGRRLGFEEGLKQGRLFAPEPEPYDDIYVDVPSNKREMKSDDDHTSRIIYPRDSKSTRHETYSSHRHSPKRHEYARSMATSRPEEESSEVTRSLYPQVSDYNPRSRHDPNVGPSSKSQHEGTPDVAKYPQPLAIPTITTPTPVRVPSTQPPIPPAIAPHVSTTIHQHHSSPPPESIKVKPSDSPIHPIPFHNSPSVRHESIVLPPDGYIPVLGADSVISLPPPHELSYPVPAEAPRRPPAPEEGPSRPKSGGKSEPRARVGNSYSANYRPPTNTDAQSHTYSTRTGRDTEKTEQEQRAPHGNSYSTTHRSSANPDAQNRTYTEKVAREIEKKQKEHRSPDTPARSLYDRPGSSASVRPNGAGPSRRAREVILPVPMGDPFDDPTTANGNLRHPPRSATPIDAPYGRPTLHADFRSPPEQTSSNTTPPDIQVETPSTHAQSVPSNRTTMVDPILLTPESANRPIALPDHRTDFSSDHHHPALGIYSTGKGDEKIEMTLPDNNLPPGFVPLSPIPGMENLNPYPPGFAPTMPRDHPSGGIADFVYSSPSVKPTAM